MYTFLTDILAQYVISILIGCSVIGLIVLHFIYQNLEKNHPQIYSNLGKPKIFKTKNSITSNLTVNYFIFKKEYKKIGDNQLNKLCGFVFFLSIFALTIFIIFLTLLLLSKFI